MLLAMLVAMAAMVGSKHLVSLLYQISNHMLQTVMVSSILSTFCRGLQCAECRGPVTRPEEASKAGRLLGPACGRI